MSQYRYTQTITFPIVLRQTSSEASEIGDCHAARALVSARSHVTMCVCALLSQAYAYVGSLSDKSMLSPFLDNNALLSAAIIVHFARYRTRPGVGVYPLGIALMVVKTDKG